MSLDMAVVWSSVKAAFVRGSHSCDERGLRKSTVRRVGRADTEWRCGSLVPVLVQAVRWHGRKGACKPASARALNAEPWVNQGCRADNESVEGSATPAARGPQLRQRMSGRRARMPAARQQVATSDDRRSQPAVHRAAAKPRRHIFGSMSFIGGEPKRHGTNRCTRPCPTGGSRRRRHRRPLPAASLDRSSRPNGVESRIRSRSTRRG